MAVVVLLAVVAVLAWFWELSRCPKPVKIDGAATLLQGAFALAAAIWLNNVTKLPLVAAAPVVAWVGGVLTSTTWRSEDPCRPSMIALGALPPVLASVAGPVAKDWVCIGAALAVVTAWGMWSNWSQSHRDDAAALPLATLGSIMLLLFLKLQAEDYAVPLTGALVLNATFGLGLSVLFGKKTPWASAAVAVLVGAGSVAAAQMGFHNNGLALVIGVATVTALVIGWVWGPGAPTPLAGALGVLAWTGVATVGFSQAQTPGLAAAVLVGLAVTCVMGRANAAAALSPLLALAAYRLLRNLAPDSLDALDIGQHYALVGLLVGCSVSIALNEFVAVLADGGKWKSTVAALAAFIVAVAMALFASLFLGDKGTVGVVVGLAFGGALSCLSGRPALIGAVFGGGLSWLVAATAAAVADAVKVDPQNKVGFLAVVVLAALGLCAIAGWLARPTREEPVATT